MRDLMLGIALLAVCVSASAADSAVRSYPLPNRGALELNVPADWQDRVEKTSDGIPPTITFSPKSGAEFRVMVTPIPLRRDVKTPNPADLKEIALKSANRVAPQSVEKNLTLQELKGSVNVGYYFAATDPAPQPGEYKLMSQGIIGVGDLVVTFTILTNDGQDEVVKKAMAMLAEAVRH